MLRKDIQFRYIMLENKIKKKKKERLLTSASSSLIGKSVRLWFTLRSKKNNVIKCVEYVINQSTGWKDVQLSILLYSSLLTL